MVERRTLEHLPRLGGGEVDHGALMPDADPAAIAAVIAEDHLQDRGFAGAGRAGQHHAFAGSTWNEDAAHHRQLDAALQMHREGLFGV